MIIKKHVIKVDSSYKCTVDKPIVFTKGDKNNVLELKFIHDIQFEHPYLIARAKRLDLIITIGDNNYQVGQDVAVSDNTARIDIKEEFLNRLTKQGNGEVRIILYGEECSIVLQPLTCVIAKPLPDVKNIHFMTEEDYALFPSHKIIYPISLENDNTLVIPEKRYLKTTIQDYTSETVNVEVCDAILAIYEEIKISMVVTNSLYGIKLNFSDNVTIGKVPETLIDGEYEIFLVRNVTEWIVFCCTLIESNL